MFQTVGHQAIDLYAEAMNLPLFRRDIKEVNFDAICSGAILSDYQQIRIENV